MSADPRTLNVSCPHCGARYLLPSNLLGPGGARVRCPGCSRSFDVPPAASASAAPAAARPEPPAVAGPRPASAALASGAQDAHAEAAPPATPGSRTLKETPHRPAGFAPAAETAGGETPEEIARHLLSALSARGGEALSAAAAQGTLFAQHGPAIFEAYDEYRRRAPKMGAGPFRDALRELWGVDLPEVTPRP